MKVFLETERLLLRYFTEADVDNLLILDSDPEVMRFINGGKPTDRATIKEKFIPRILEYYNQYKNYGIWAAIDKSSQNFMGWFHFFPATNHPIAVELNLINNQEIALGYRLKKSYWGKGFASEVSGMLVSKGFADWEVEKVIAWALLVNKGSIRVMEKAGLKYEKEFIFTESQLPNIKPEERKAVKYGIDRLAYYDNLSI